MFTASARNFCRKVLPRPSKYVQHQAWYNTNRDLQSLIAVHLGISESFANLVILSGNGILYKMPERHIINNCELCKNLEIDEKYPKLIECCLRLNTLTIKHRIALLQEIGMKNIHIAQIYRLSNVLRNAEYDVKVKYNIPLSEDIVQNLLDNIKEDLPKNFYDRNAPNAPILISDHCKQIVLKYKEWKLQTTHPRLRKYQTPVFQSMRMVKGAIDIVTKELGFDTNFILKYPYLMHMCPDNAHSIVNGLEDERIGGREFSEVIKKWPYILFCDMHNVKRLLKHMKEYNICDRAVFNTLNIFTLDSDVFVKRMKECRKTPELSTWIDHPRILYMILHKKLVDQRVHQLRVINYMKRVNTHTISSVKSFFERILLDETHHVVHWKFLVYVVEKELGIVNENALCKLSYHPYWKNITFQEIENTLSFLKQNDFSAAEIYNNVHIILYARSRVEKTLVDVKRTYIPEKGYNFTSNQQLAVTLYLLEKNNYFSGDGVWLRNSEHDYNHLYQIFDKLPSDCEQNITEENCNATSEEDEHENSEDTSNRDQKLDGFVRRSK
ncbi:hypothetical protein KM043_001113 [Ampulex compressa]|nr:hypothetical protein KM043_001113 [Ampulex compressa]